MVDIFDHYEITVSWPSVSAMVIRTWWARELGHEQEVGSRHVLQGYVLQGYVLQGYVLQEYVLQEYVLQEYVLEIRLFVNGKLGAVPWFGSLNLYFLTVVNPCRNGRRERISSSEAMIYQWTSLRLCMMVKKDNIPRPYMTVSKLFVGKFREGN
jgi:hypothetical protein